jgi:hypothetical protein
MGWMNWAWSDSVLLTGHEECRAIAVLNPEPDRSVKGICAGQNRVDRRFAQERRLGPAVEFAQ